jgi:hypothetical protein
MTVKNASIETGEKWTADGLTYTEMIIQKYTNCSFSAGTVEGHPVDTLYIRFLRGDDDRMFLLRPDEAAALAWCLTGILWSDAMGKHTEATEPKDAAP